jgi:hypothetical protein
MTGQQAVPAESAELAASSRFAFDARRWTRYEAITLALSLLLLFFLSGPWYDVRLADCPPKGLFAHRHPCRITDITSFGGTAAHAYLWITILPVLIIMAVLVLRAGFGRVAFLIWPTDRQLLAGAACVNLVVVLSAFLTKSGIVSAHPHRVTYTFSLHLSIIWKWGAYIALAIAAAAAAAAVLSAVLERHHRK